MEEKPASNKDTEKEMHKVGVKKFFKKILLSAKKNDEKRKAKESFEKQLNKVKKLAVSGVEQDAIEKALKNLDKKLQNVLHKEGKLLVHDVKDNLMSQEMKLRLMELEDRLNEIGQYDVEVIESLRDNINDLKENLYESESVNRQKIDYLNTNMAGLRSQLEYYMQAKEERDKKMEELEEKIKRQAVANANEIETIEREILVFEEKFDKVNKLGRYADKNVSERIKSRLDFLKHKLFMKKAGVTQEQEHMMNNLPEKKVNYPMPSQPPKREVPSNPQIKHDIRMEPPKETARPGELPPLPPLPPMPKSLQKNS